MSGVAIREFERVPLADVDALARFGVATVHEALGRSGLMAPSLRPVWAGAAVAGNAVTVTVAPGDNFMIHVAVELTQEGDILVVAPTSPCSDGYFGELLGSALKARGVRATVIDAGCRDVRALEEIGFPVWSQAISAQGTVKETLGTVNLPIVCAGQAVSAGDVVVADDDGVVVVPAARAPSVIAAARTRVEREEANRARFVAGELGLDVYGMREKLAAKGLTYYRTEAEYRSKD